MGRHTLTRRERDAVRETVIWTITSGCSDLEMSLAQHQDYRAARRLWRQLEDAVALLDDLGWDPDDRREVFELSLPRKRLRRSRGGSRRARPPICSPTPSACSKDSMRVRPMSGL
jgi:hypothetical protein